MKPLISVIVPIYKVENTLQSVLIRYSVRVMEIWKLFW